MEAAFTAGEASRLAGFAKPWMLGHLEREQIFRREHFRDKRHGRARKYTFADVVILRAINRMLELGARPARIKTIVSRLGELDGLHGPRAQVENVARNLGTRLIITDKEAMIVENATQVIDLLSSNQFSFGFMIEFADCVRPVADVIATYEAKREKLWKQNKEILEELCVKGGI